MVDHDLVVELEYSDGFREGFLQGYIAAIKGDYNDCGHEECPKPSGEPGPCDLDDCGRKD